MTLRFGSVCSGIEAASTAWNPLGWEAAWLSEIEPFPSAVLAHHYPDVPNLGDMTLLPDRIANGEVEAPDLFCGGTPCQAFSVAGLRKSLDDARGNLSLVFCEIANAIDTQRAGRNQPPAIIFWENVPGVLSTKDNAFGCFLAGLAGEEDPVEPPRGKWTNSGVVLGPQRAVAWRILDAQYFGVAQRRRRVFVVASARDDFDPASVLFEFDGMRRDTAPSRQERQNTAPSAGSSLAGGIDYEGNGHTADEPTGPLLKGSPTGGGHPLPAIITMAHGQGGAEIGFDRGPTLTCNHEAPIAAYTTKLHNTQSNQAGKVYEEYATSLDANSPPPAVFQPIPFDTTQITSPANYSKPQAGDPCHPLAAGAHPPAVAQPIAFAQNQRDEVRIMQVAGALAAEPGMKQQTFLAHAIPIDTMNMTPGHSSGGLGFGQPGDPSFTLTKGHSHAVAQPVAFQQTADCLTAAYGTKWNGNASATNGSLFAAQAFTAPAEVGPCMGSSGPPYSRTGNERVETEALAVTTQPPMAVRRLTPVECERLQGFPDNYTQIPWRKKPSDECPDGPRYKALGNSWAVPVVAWIGRRIHNAVLAAKRMEKEAA
jgi:DNA (cytosine-5)-methyltransferase 1